jgi:transposase-like protein
MSKGTEVIDQAAELLRRRLAEIEEERQRLERALAALGRKVSARRPGRPRGRKARAGKSATAPKRRGKRRGGGRADQAAALVEKSPGISASDVAKRMKIKPNYLYRVLSDLEKEGRVKKDGRQYYPAS